MSAEYDLMIAINDHMLKISVKGSSDGGWGIITLRRNAAPQNGASCSVSV